MKTTDVSAINLSCWNKLLLEDRNQLPEASGIYAILSEGNVYYVGKSVNIKSRWSGSGHHRVCDCRSLVNPYLYYCEFPKHMLNELEQVAIFELSPLWNGRVVSRDGLVSCANGGYRDSTYALISAKIHNKQGKSWKKYLEANPEKTDSDVVTLLVDKARLLNKLKVIDKDLNTAVRKAVQLHEEDLHRNELEADIQILQSPGYQKAVEVVQDGGRAVVAFDDGRFIEVTA